MYSTRLDTRKLTRVALLGALVVILQIIAAYVQPIPNLSLNFSLVPVIVGAVLYGPLVGGFLGGVSAVVILAMPSQTAFFYGISIFGTIFVVLLKGITSGALAGWVASVLNKENTVLAVYSAAAVCPVVNTGIFLLGCRVFFYDDFVVGAAAAAEQSPVAFLFVGLAGLNFLIEFGINMVLAPVIIRVLPVIGARIAERTSAKAASSAEPTDGEEKENEPSDEG